MSTRTVRGAADGLADVTQLEQGESSSSSRRGASLQTMPCVVQKRWTHGGTAPCLVTDRQPLPAAGVRDVSSACCVVCCCGGGRQPRRSFRRRILGSLKRRTEKKRRMRTSALLSANRFPARRTDEIKKHPAPPRDLEDAFPRRKGSSFRWRRRHVAVGPAALLLQIGIVCSKQCGAVSHRETDGAFSV
ncbi:hypothetical protein MRX96_021323 [Rhipicephalus microplus]